MLDISRKGNKENTKHRNNNNKISGKIYFCALFIYCFFAVLIINMICRIIYEK